MILSYIVFALIGAVYTQSEQLLPDAISLSHPGLVTLVHQKHLHQIMAQSDKFQINEVIHAVREKCEINGGVDAFPRFERIPEEFGKCLPALPKGQFNEVYRNYCEKTPVFKACFQNLTYAIEPCLAADEKIVLQSVNRIVGEVVDLICFKEGDRIAQFIAEHGPECLQEKGYYIQECLQKTNIDQEDITNVDIKRLLSLQLVEKECSQIDKMHTCLMKSLETCSTPTSASNFESLYKLIRDSTMCKGASSAASLTAKSMGFGIILLAFLV